MQLPEKRILCKGPELAKCVLINEKNEAVVAGSLWQNQPAILVFLRHFACDACRRHAVDVWQNRAAYEAKGAKLHFIGNGTPYFMNSFREMHGLQEASFFTDPTLNSFNAAGFRRGFWIDPGEMHTRPEFLYKAIRHQMRQTGSGNVWQLGGIVALKPGDKVTYQFISQMMGDFPPKNDVPKMAEANT